MTHANTNDSSGANANANTPPQPGAIKAILIDDEPLARMIVKEYLQTYPEITIVQECSDGFEGIKAIQQHHPDLLFLDIQMPKINGFEMLELVEQPPAVIFTTAFDEYAIRAFESHAVDYLLKPFSKDRFDKAVRKWLDQHAARNATIAAGAGAATATASGSSASPAATSASGTPTSGLPSAETSNNTAPADPTAALLETAAQSPTQQHRIVVKTGGKIKIIPLEDIHFLEAADDYVKIHTHNGAFLKNRTMGYFEQTLDPSQFVRTHRSYILNIQQVTRIDPYEKDSHLCILQSGAQVPVSKAGYVKLKTVLGL
jgi:two-component system LytT family response regulator